MRTEREDGGFTLIELLIVIVVLGLLALVVVLSVGGVTEDAEDAACASDERILTTAVQVYFVQNGTVAIPPATVATDRYEQTLVDAGHLHSVSEYFEVQADGTVVGVAPCD